VHIADDRLNTGSIEVVGFRVVISRGGDNDIIGAPIGIMLIRGGAKIQLFCRQILFNFFINDRRFFLIQHIDFSLHDIQCDHFMMLRNQNTVR
jgi:hypothetical protein